MGPAKAKAKFGTPSKLQAVAPARARAGIGRLAIGDGRSNQASRVNEQKATIQGPRPSSLGDWELRLIVSSQTQAAMRCRISFRAGLFWGISLSGLLSSTSCADAATVTLEPLVSNSVSSFVLTSRLRVVNNSTDENDGDLFPIDLYSTDRITFILQPPKGIDEIRLSSSAPGKAIELIVRASLVEGPNADRCQSSNADADAAANADGDGAFDQLLVGAFFQASVAGRDADVLSEAFAWERSYVSIEKYGCGVEGRLFFQPTVDEGVILASIEKISWSARYDLDLLGGTGIGDGSSEEALYALVSEGDALIRGGDASMVFGSEKETSDSPADVAASNESTTSAGCCKFHGVGLAVAIFFAAFASLTGF